MPAGRSPSQVPGVSTGGPLFSSREGSTTPTPKGPRGTTPDYHTPEAYTPEPLEVMNPYDGNNGVDDPISPTTDVPRESQSEQTRPSRHGKQRRLDPFSDEEGGDGEGDEDIAMDDHPSQQRYGGVCSISGLMPPDTHLCQSRLATEDDILKMCRSFHILTRDFVKEVLAELRKGNGRREGVGYTADDESDGDVPRPRFVKRKSRYPGERRRPPEENALSVYFFSSLLSTPDLIFTESHSNTYEGIDSRRRLA